MMDGASSEPLVDKVCRFYTEVHGLAYAQVAPDLTIVEASPNLRDLVTPNAKSVVGQPLADLFWEFVGAEDALYAVLHGESASYRLEWINFILPDGTTTYLTFEVTALDAADPEAGLLFIITNATAHGMLEQIVMQDRNELSLAKARLDRANAELQRVLQFKSLMLSLASSEFRTPLTTIRLYAGLLMKEPAQVTAQDRRRFIATIYGQANRMDSLVNDLLDLDLIEAGCLKIDRISCDLNALVRQVTEVMSAVVIPRRLNWSLDLPEQPLLVQGDAEHLWRIVYNLSNSAVKHSPENGLIQISGRAEADFVVLRINDAGPGLTEEQLAQLFQPYYRVEAVPHNPLTGADLGLFVVKYLVEAHGGRLEVSSQSGQGTTFTVHLPLS
jgi:signal transduction histidine kinase